MQKRQPKRKPAAPPKPKTEPEPQSLPADLLRAMVHRFDPKQAESARAALLAMILGSIAEMSALRLQDVARAVDIIEHDRGCSTPVESFITNLLSDHYVFGLTPEAVIGELESSDGFRANFADAMEVAKRLAATHRARLRGYRVAA
jgi:hypothetical protein